MIYTALLLLVHTEGDADIVSYIPTWRLSMLLVFPEEHCEGFYTDDEQ